MSTTEFKNNVDITGETTIGDNLNVTGDLDVTSDAAFIKEGGAWSFDDRSNGRLGFGKLSGLGPFISGASNQDIVFAHVDTTDIHGATSKTVRMTINTDGSVVIPSGGSLSTGNCFMNDSTKSAAFEVSSGGSQLAVFENPTREILHIKGSTNAEAVTIKGKTTIHNPVESSSVVVSGTAAAARILSLHGSIGSTSNGGFEVYHTNGTSGIGIGYAGIYATGSITDRDMNVNAAGTGTIRLNANVVVSGSLSKGSGSFVIPHPDPVKKEKGYKLKHCFVESPTAGDNIYRFECVANTDKQVVSIELPDYYNYLNHNTDLWINGIEHFGNAFGKINEEGTKLLITCEKAGKYKVLCIGTRKDEIAVKHWETGHEYIEKTDEE